MARFLFPEREYLKIPPVAETTQEARAVTKSRNMVGVAAAASNVALQQRPGWHWRQDRLPPLFPPPASAATKLHQPRPIHPLAQPLCCIYHIHPE